MLSEHELDNLRTFLKNMSKPIIHPPDFFHLHSVLLQRLKIRSKKNELSFVNTQRIVAPSAAVFVAALVHELETKRSTLSRIRQGVCKGSAELVAAIEALLFVPGNGDLFDDGSPAPQSFCWSSFGQKEILGVVPRGSLRKSDVPTFIFETLLGGLDPPELAGTHKDLVAYPLIEMVKNTLDHTSDAATFGLSFNPEERKLCALSYCEVGEGFSVKLRRRLREMDYKRWEKEDLVGLIKWCVTPGNTTRPSSDSNMGLGMGIIVGTLERMGINLYMLDAASEIHLNGFIKSGLSYVRLREKRQGTRGASSFIYLGLSVNAKD